MAASAGQPFNVNTAATQGLQAGMAGTAQGMGFNAAQAANQYANPFQQNVISGLQGDANRNYQMMSNQLGTEATRAGAFGGSRHGVAQGQMAADIQRNLNNQIGNLRYQGYNQALGQASADQQMRLNAANQMASLGNLGFGMGRQANQDMMMQGAMQQALQQQVMDRASQQYQGMQNAPYQSLSAVTSALGSTPYPQTSTSTQNTQRGLMDYMMMAAMMA